MGLWCLPPSPYLSWSISSRERGGKGEVQGPSAMKCKMQMQMKYMLASYLVHTCRRFPLRSHTFLSCGVSPGMSSYHPLPPSLPICLLWLIIGSHLSNTCTCLFAFLPPYQTTVFARHHASIPFCNIRLAIVCSESFY